MVDRAQRIENLDDLRSFVNRTICDLEQLELGAFPISERILLRRGKPCGIYFCVLGPRAVRFSAIWETEQNRILFYDASGERYHRTQLIANFSFATSDRPSTDLSRRNLASRGAELGQNVQAA